MIERVLVAPAGDQDYMGRLSEKVKQLLDIRPDMEDRRFLEKIVKDYYCYAYVDIV
ncbi:MAG: hypothetical protein LUD15_15110 [Bacteroides sp.]|nr:hypothetical protein [Bacteroides sp.]